MAYRLTPKTVIRSGFGLFYMNLDQATYTIDLPLNPPWESDISLFAPPTGPVDPVTHQVVVPVTNMTTGFPANAFNDPSLVSQSLLFPVTARPLTPYTLNWNFTIQQELSPNTTLEVAYSGTHGNHFGSDNGSDGWTRHRHGARAWGRGSEGARRRYQGTARLARRKCFLSAHGRLREGRSGCAG